MIGLITLDNFYLGVLLATMTVLTANAQRTVIGQLVDKETGKPVKDATVILSGTDVKTISNSLGYFQLQADSLTIIEINHFDYPTMQVQLPKENRFKVELTKALVGEKPAKEKYSVTEEPPSFPGGLPNFYKYVNKNMKTPKEVKNGSVSGQVLVEFIIDSLGQIPRNKIKVTHELCKSCDEEAIRLISESPKWNPGVQKDKPVNILMHLPIIFK